MIDNHRNDIRASGGTVRRQHTTETDSKHTTSDDSPYPRISDDRFRQNRYDAIPEGDCRYPDRSTDGKAPPDRQASDQQQDRIENEGC